jgi:hypothetical protein
LTKLCKTLQTRDFLYSYVKPRIALAIGEIKGMKVNSGVELKLFERPCSLSPADKPQKAIWKICERENEVEIKCTTAMIEQFTALKKQYLQSLADNLERRLSSQTPDGSVLEALTELTSPKAIHAMSRDFTNEESQETSQLEELINAVCAWYDAKQTQYYQYRR